MVKIGLISHDIKGTHATHSFSKEFLRCIPNSTLLHIGKLCGLETAGKRDYLEGYDILFINRIGNFIKINLDRIPPKTKVILWAHGIDHVFTEKHQPWLKRCDKIGFTAPAAFAQKASNNDGSWFLLEYGVCPYPTKGLTNPYMNSRNIFYAGRMYDYSGKSHIMKYLHAASELGNLHIISVSKPPADLNCTYLGPKNHGTFVEYYLYADASLDCPYLSRMSIDKPNRTFVNCKALDCIYYGLPVVVPGAFGGDHWIIESGCGIISEVESVDGFRDAMRQVLDDPWRFKFAQKRLDKSLTWEERFKKCEVTNEWMASDKHGIQPHKPNQKSANIPKRMLSHISSGQHYHGSKH